MRVYLISANWGHGGPGGVAGDLYYTLSKLGNECRFACARGEVPDNVNSYRIGKKRDVYIHALTARILDKAGFMSTKATQGMINDIIQFNPDIISIQNPLGYSMNIELLLDFIRKSKIVTFWTLHDCWAFTGHCITGVCERLDKGCGHCIHKKDFPKSYVIDNSKNNLLRKIKSFSNISTLRLITPSQWLADLIKKTYLNQYPVYVINNGIDLDVFKPIASDLREQWGLTNKKVLLCVAGVWTRTKGSNYIYRIIEKLDDSYIVVMIGKNNDAELKNNQRIIHVPKTEDRNELAKWYTTADIFLNPTMGDNFPTVNLEALACGTPIVTFDTGGSKESVGNCGRVVAQGDVDSMVTEIISCFNEHISKDKCLERAKKYDKSARYGDYVSLFEKYANKSV